MPEAYPLAWPLAVPRTPADKRRRALFGKRNDRGYGTKRLTVGRAADRFAGFQALPAPGQTSGAAWWEVLGLTPDASADDVRRAYRQAAHDAHPDRGGSREQWDRLVEAYRMGLAVTNRS